MGDSQKRFSFCVWSQVAMLSKACLAALAIVFATAENTPPVEVIASDDECSGDEQCSLNALQRRATPDSTEDGYMYEHDGEWKVATGTEVNDTSNDTLGAGWYQGGDKMWGAGAGVENINGGNVGYYNAGFASARARCGGPGCALIVNPPGHRSINRFHIHFVHYAGYGHNLKKRLEAKVCGHGGWHGGGLPCGGKAKFFPGSPGVMSAAMSGGSVHHASVIAWPASCGGRGTIVELAFGCSIEHQIRGDFNPHLR